MKKIIILCSFLFSCATYRPILNDNDQYQKVGEQKAELDIDECMAKADAYLKKHKDEKIKNQMARQAVGGAVIGGVIGALSGDAGKALGGAALGAGVGAGGAYVDEKTKGSFKPDELKQAYISKCLQNKKYEVLGWK